MNGFLKIIKNYKLEKYLKQLILNNSGNNNPYHNFHHSLTIIKNIYFICKDLKIDEYHTRLMIIAGLFHDFNHSGGKEKDDSKNIEEAIKAFRKYSSEESIPDEKFVESIIEVTRYPYIKTEGLTIYEKIIRDDDLLQGCETNFIQQILFGLGKEMNNVDKLTIDGLNGQIKFMENTNFHTEWAKKKAKEKFVSLFEDCKYLINVLNHK